ncbi:MAG: M20/M25/M40 family metallo-hydrolase [Candidatus Paceibacterota bacterium]
MDKKELIELTSNLVKIDSSKNDGRFDIVEFVKKFFENEQVFVKVFNQNDYPVIIVSLSEGKNFDLILSGHLDVVPGNIDQFNPVVKKGRMYGRGTGDMKAGCAAMMLALRTFARDGQHNSVALMLTTDEEIGGRNGTEYLIKKEKYRAGLVIAPDGGTELSTIVVNKKGILQLKLKGFGKSAHGSRPFWGENAIDKLIKDYLKLRKIIPELKTRQWKTTMNLGLIKGGDAVNKVPDYAEMLLDVRYPGIKDKEFILKKINSLFSNAEVVMSGEPFIQDPKHPFVQMYKKVSADVLGKKIEFGKMEGSSDARFFSELGIPAIITRIDSPNIHTKDEYVEIKAIEDFYKILLVFIPKYLNSGK